MEIYKTYKWKLKREKILWRDQYMCQLSKRYGRARQADTVHHIFPVEYFPEYAWCDWNLVSLSNAEHNACHIRDTHELSPKGLELLKRTALKQGIDIAEFLKSRS